MSDAGVEEAPALAAPRRRRRAVRAAVVVIVVLAGAAAVLVARAPGSTRVVDAPIVGQPAPPIDAPTVDGGRVKLRDLRGQWVLVNYFATWCVPCREEHPELVRFAARHARDVRVVGVVFADDFGAVRAFRRANGGDWPMAEDPDGSISVAWGVTGVPQTFLVDPAGVVRAKLLGGVTVSKLEQALQDVSGPR